MKVARTVFQVFKGLHQESCRAYCPVVNGLANLGCNHLDYGFDQGARGVVFAAVASGVAHVFDLVLVEVAHFVLFYVGAEAQLVDSIDDFPQVVAALDAVFELAENFTNFVFDGIGAFGLGFEFFEVGKKLDVDKIGKVVAGEGAVVIQFAVFIFWCRPGSPLKFRTDDVSVGFACEFRRGGFVLLQVVKVFEEEYPGGLFHVVEFAAATRVFVEDVVDVFEGLFEHGGVGG